MITHAKDMKMNDKYLKIQKKMKDAKDTRYKKYASDRVRCPSLKVMADYINNVLNGYTAKITSSESCKGVKAGRFFVSSSTCYGNKITVKKGTYIVLEHDATQTYRYNGEVANWIQNKETQGK